MTRLEHYENDYVDLEGFEEFASKNNNFIYRPFEQYFTGVQYLVSIKNK